MAGRPPAPGTRAATLGPDFSDSHLSQSCHHEPGNSCAPAFHSSSVGGFFAVSFSQRLYFLLPGGLTSPALCSVARCIKRPGPAKIFVAMYTYISGATMSYFPGCRYVPMLTLI